MVVEDATQIYRTALEKWGPESQLNMLVEECGELVAAVNRFRRERTPLIGLLEEIADVEIMLEQMRLIFDGALIDACKRQKQARLAILAGLDSGRMEP
jgi:NTP pyrophosphatase (non-canonical NTP hydrolase)